MAVLVVWIGGLVLKEVSQLPSVTTKGPRVQIPEPPIQNHQLTAQFLSDLP